ncbi:FliO/MopB family protein [Demequina sp.]|uniref:FliO/MopB family protein n=1 Tax=Demequina sp. TaxID=2050685 RepID=UPI003A886F73
MPTLLLVLRVGLSLAAVLGLLWWISRRLHSRLGGQGPHSTLTVLARQHLGKRAGVAVIEADGRRLVVGFGEHGVSLLHDAGFPPGPPPGERDTDLMGASALHDPDPVEAWTAAAPQQRTPLEGSILSPDTWRQAAAALQERTTHRI